MTIERPHIDLPFRLLPVRSGHTELEVAGDGWPFGDYASSYSKSYIARIGRALGLDPVNRANDGSVLVGDQQAPASEGWVKALGDLRAAGRGAGTAPYLKGSDLFVVDWLLLNELAYLGAEPQAIAAIKMAHRVHLSNIRAAKTGVFTGAHASVTLSAGWAAVNDATVSASGTYYTTAVDGETVTIHVPADFPGGTIAWGCVYSAEPAHAVYGVTVDGEAQPNLDTSGLTAGVKAANRQPAIQRLVGLSAGAHTVVITVLSHVLRASFDYWLIEAPLPPRALLYNQPRVPEAGYDAFVDYGLPHRPDDDMAISVNTAVADLVQEFDGYVVLVDADAAIQADRSKYFGAGADLLALAPNDAGHGILASIGIQAIPDVTPARVATVEQDTAEHVRSCQSAIIACPVGFRQERPEFGWPFPTFRNAPIDTEALRTALTQFEPRDPDPDITEFADQIDQAVRHVSVVSRVEEDGSG